MSNSLRKSELRVAGILLSGLGLLGLAGCASDNETVSQPTVSTSPTTETPAPEASVTPSANGIQLSPEVARISHITSLDEANSIMESFVVKATSSGEKDYLTTNDILITALDSGNLTVLAKDYAIDKGEIDQVITSLSSIISSQEDKVYSITDSQIQILMDKYLAYTPIDTMDSFRARLALLDMIRQHPNYESSIPNTITDCIGAISLKDRMIAEPLGFPLSREMFTCEPDTVDTSEIATFYRSPQGISNTFSYIINLVKNDPLITTETVDIMTEWYDVLHQTYTKTEY